MTVTQIERLQFVVLESKGKLAGKWNQANVQSTFRQSVSKHNCIRGRHSTIIYWEINYILLATWIFKLCIHLEINMWSFNITSLQTFDFWRWTISEILAQHTQISNIDSPRPKGRVYLQICTATSILCTATTM